VQRQRQGKSDLSVTGTRRVIIIRKFASERNLQIGLTLAEVLITKLGMYIVFFGNIVCYLLLHSWASLRWRTLALTGHVIGADVIEATVADEFPFVESTCACNVFLCCIERLHFCQRSLFLLTILYANDLRKTDVLLSLCRV